MATTAMPMSADQVQKKMSANSAAWQIATPQIRDLLHQENLDLSKQTGQSYNSAAGTYSTPTPSTPMPAMASGGGGVIPQAVVNSGGGGGGPVNADGSPYVWKGAPSGGGGGGGGTPAIPQPGQGYPPPDYAALAASRTAAALAQKRTIAESQKGSLDRSFARDNQITNDNRTLENGQINRTLSPFSGKTAYDKGIIGRERTLADESKSNNLAAQKSNIDQLLSDYENATAQEQMKIADELQRADRSYQLDLAKFNQDQSNSDRTFNYGAGRDSKLDAINADNTSYNRSKYDSETAYNHGQDSISNNRNAANDAATNTGYWKSPETQAIEKRMADNSSAYASASPSEQKRLHDENIALGKQIGLTDSSGSGDYSGNTSTRTLAGQQIDHQKARDAIADEQYKMKFDEDVRQYGMDFALKQAVEAGQLRISQQNADTSAASAANGNQNAKDRLAFDKEQAANKTTTPKPKQPDDYKTDTNFASDLAHIRNNPNEASKLDTNAQQFIDAYGYDGYMALRKAAGLD